MSTRLTARQCSEQFRLYAKTNPHPERAHAYNHAADFLDEFCEGESTETRWPNVQAAIAGDANIAGYLNSITNQFVISTDYHDGQGVTLEDALDSLERELEMAKNARAKKQQELAERKEGK